jgi:hypothetical protein
LRRPRATAWPISETFSCESVGAASSLRTVNGVRVAGIPIQGPSKPEVQSIEVGINRVFAAFASNQILVFDDLPGLLDELQSYSRELDDMGEPTEKIEAKESFHILDCVRYIIGFLNTDKSKSIGSGSPVARPGCRICEVNR